MTKTLRIDKESMGVCFNEKEHKYWDQKTGDKYTSVTQIIGKYKSPFDTVGISLLSACKSLDIYVSLKDRANIIKHISCFDPDIKGLVESKAKAIRYEWAVNNARDCRNGTLVHSILENNIGNEFTKDYKIVSNWNDFITTHNAIFPEALIFNNKFMVCGQVDLIVKHGSEITIIDYKTASSFHNIDRSYGNYQGILSDMPESKLNNYKLQLSMYASLLNDMLSLYFNYKASSYSLELDLITLDNDVRDLLNDYSVLVNSSHVEICNEVRLKIAAYVEANTTNMNIGDPLWVTASKLISGNINE